MPELTQTFFEEYGLSDEQLGRNAKRTRWIGFASIVIGVLALLLPGVFMIGFEILIGVDFLVLGFWLISFASVCEKASFGTPRDKSLR